MEGEVKGSATSLASLFPAEDAQKAARFVEEAICENQKHLEQLHHFISDNNNLLKRVQRLPDELSHNIMVPFGKAAFFPGRLVHTNEFLVLLGEGYYAERTSKQTVDILQRRGKLLDSQVDSLKAVMSDLKAEASFFDATATEVADGSVEIQEIYCEELSSEGVPNLADSSRSTLLGSSENSNRKANDDDEEYARIMARLDELEKEELAAESVNEGDEVKDRKTNIECSVSPDYFEKSLQISEFDDSMDQHIPKGGSLQEKQVMGKVIITEQPSLRPEPREKAFTGSIIEHSIGLRTKSSSQTSTSSQANDSVPSKPVSRFKMQKGGR